MTWKLSTPSSCCHVSIRAKSSNFSKESRNPKIDKNLDFFFNSFIFGCAGSLLLCTGFLYLKWAGFSLQWLLLLQSTGSRAVAHRLSCSTACGIFLDQGLNPCTLHCKADSQPLGYQGSLDDDYIKNDESLFLLNLYFDGDWGGVRQKPNIYLYMRKLMQKINKQGR